MLRLIKFLIISLMLIFSAYISASAASFNCAKASSEIEKSICNDPSLGKLDEILSDLYHLKRSIDLPKLTFDALNEPIDLRTTDGEDHSFQIIRFSKDDTLQEQLEWIRNIRDRCYANTVCLNKKYIDRISNFYSNLSDHPYQGWGIYRTLVLPEDSVRVVIWKMDLNRYNDSTYLSYEPPFETIYYLVSVHDLQSGKLLDYNPNLIEPTQSPGWAGKELHLFSNRNSTFEITTHIMVGAYLHNTSHLFKVNQMQTILEKYTFSNFDRRSHDEQKITLDMVKKYVLRELNGIESKQEIQLNQINLSEASAAKLDILIQSTE